MTDLPKMPALGLANHRHPGSAGKPLAIAAPGVASDIARSCSDNLTRISDCQSLFQAGDQNH
jgi:hypothetical protein